MKTRYKTFAEFMKTSKIAYDNKEVIIACLRTVLYRGQRPWNSPQTRKSFLAKLYIKHVLQRKNISLLVQRIEGYELLGKRFIYKRHEVIVCSTQEMVDTDTGEILIMAILVADHRPQPFKLLLKELYDRP